MLEEFKEILGIKPPQLKTMKVVKIIGESVECNGNGETKIMQGDYSVGDEVLVSGSNIFALKESNILDIWVE